tara:strand:- start:1063 stop:1287 length:225 start_codon:yes stop_codon:yes gene_type:complete
MFDFKHVKKGRYFSHLWRSLKVAAFLCASGLFLLVHAILPFWQQPESFRLRRVGLLVRKEVKKITIEAIADGKI